MNLTRRVPNLLGLAAIAGMASACGDGNTFEGPNKAIITPLSNWTSNGLTGEFSSPLFPVSIPSTNSAVNYVAQAVGWRLGWNPPGTSEPLTLEIKVYSPPQSTFYVTLVAESFEIHPSQVGKVRAIVASHYYASRYGNSKPDTAKVTTFNAGGAPSTSTGKAILPWKFDNVNSAVNGTPFALKNTEVWVQAVSTSLPTPHTYLWKVNSITLNGVNRSYHDTVYTTVGPRIYDIKITGSNGQFVNKSWSMGITCPGGGIFC